VREARQIVQRIDQPLHQIGLGRCHVSVRSLTERFLKLFVLGGEPQVLVLHVREVTLETGDRLLRRLISAPDSGPAGWSGAAVFLLVVHGVALHEQSVCRPRCAVLAGLVGARVRK